MPKITCMRSILGADKDKSGMDQYHTAVVHYAAAFSHTPYGPVPGAATDGGVMGWYCRLVE